MSINDLKYSETKISKKTIVTWLIKNGVLKGSRLIPKNKVEHEICCPGNESVCDVCGEMKCAKCDYDNCVCEHNRLLEELEELT